MDKNMIKIDDLVRQRLSGGEEQERAGAWLHMRDLLDDKMPVRQAGGYNWRRMLTAATGVLLFASLTVGGYKMYTRFRPNDEVLVASNANNPANGMSSGNFNGKAVPGNNGNENDLALTVNANNTAENTPESGFSSAAPINTPVDGSVNREAEINTKANAGIQKAATLNQTQSTSITKNTNNNSSSTNLSNKNVGGTNTPLAGTNTATAPANSTSSTTSSNGNAPANTGASNPVAKSGTTANQNQPAPAQQNPSSSLTAEKANESSSQEISLVKQDLDNTMVKKTIVLKDSMPKIAITEKVTVDPIRRTAMAQRDTTSVSKMAVEKVEEKVFASAQKVAPSKATSNVVPQANTNTALKAHNPSSSSQLKMKAQKSSFLNMDRLNEMIAETQFRLGQVKFHTGITFGINNYMYNTNSMMGIHIGLREVAQFDEKWSMFGEFKYMQRFNKSYAIKDNYWRVNTIAGNEYQASEIEHFFKFSALHTVEMPIAVRYALLKQLNLFAGVNLVYNFKINAEEVTRISEEKTYTGNSFSLQSKPSIDLDHFGTRFSAGYLLGLGYQISPAFDVDLRMTRNFWDNAAGSGPRKISDQLLYRPSFQLSIGYKFSQKNKVPPAK